MKWEIVVAGPEGYICKQMSFEGSFTDALQAIVGTRKAPGVAEVGEVCRADPGAANASTGG